MAFVCCSFPQVLLLLLLPRHRWKPIAFLCWLVHCSLESEQIELLMVRCTYLLWVCSVVAVCFTQCHLLSCHSLTNLWCYSLCICLNFYQICNLQVITSSCVATTRRPTRFCTKIQHKLKVSITKLHILLHCMDIISQNGCISFTSHTPSYTKKSI